MFDYRGTWMLDNGMQKMWLAACVAGLLMWACGVGRADWPGFRGPRGDGHVVEDGAAVPLRWGEGQNVAWKTEIPHRGWSSPVVAAGKVWLTTATLEGHDFFVVAVDAASGRVIHNERLFHSDNPEPLGNPINCYASPTPVVEAGRVYVHFGSYGTACLDTTDYRTIWRREDIPCRHYRGPGSSPVLFEDQLILTMDGVDVQYVIALDKRTGETVWKTDRTADWDDLGADGLPFSEGDLRKAYSTPLIVEVGGGPLMITAGAKAAYGYNPRTGKELWKVNHTAFSGAAMPVFGHAMAFIVTGFGRTELWAVRVDGQGDVTDTHVVWRARKAVPRTPSPLLAGELLFMVADNGVLACLEARTGDEVWSQRLRGDFAASPIHADGRIYLCDQAGTTTVIRAARTFEVLAENKLESGFMASPAVADGALFLRTRTHLYRIEATR